MQVKRTIAFTAIALALGVHASNVMATPSEGLTTTPVASKIRFDAFQVHSHTTPANRWQATLRTHGETDVHVVKNRLTPGGTTGWHSHPGPSLVMVTAGSVTNYSPEHPDCGGVTYSAGEGFIDEGGSHVHTLRNHGSAPAETVAMQILPAGADRRQNVDQVPEGCGS